MIKNSEVLSEFIKSWLGKNETEELVLAKARKPWSFRIIVMYENNLVGKDQEEKELLKADIQHN